MLMCKRSLCCTPKVVYASINSDDYSMSVTPQVRSGCVFVVHTSTHMCVRRLFESIISTAITLSVTPLRPSGLEGAKKIVRGAKKTSSECHPHRGDSIYGTTGCIYPNCNVGRKRRKRGRSCTHEHTYIDSMMPK